MTDSRVKQMFGERELFKYFTIIIIAANFAEASFLLSFYCFKTSPGAMKC